MPAPVPLGQLAQALLVAGGLLAIAGVVFALQLRGMVFPLLALSGLALGVMVLVRPAIGLAMLVFCAAAVRVNISTGTDSPIVASLVCACLLLAGWLAHRVLHRQPLALLPRSIALPGALLVGFTFFSIVWGRLTLDPRITFYPGFIRVQLAAAALTLVAVGLLFVGADLLRSREARTIVMLVIVGVGIVALPFRALALGVPVLNSAGLFGLWFVAICWAQALGNTRLPDLARLALGTLAAGWLAMALLREWSWVSGWLPALVAFIAVTLALRPRLGVALLLLGVILLAFQHSVFYDMLITQQEHDGSLGGEFGRLELWQRNLSVLGDHVIFGTGPAGYALYYVTFLPNQAMSTHNNYIDIVAQNGIFGLLSFVALLVGLGRLCVRIRPRVVDGHDRATWAAVAGGLPAMAVAMGLGDWVIPFVYNQTIAGFDHAAYSWLMLATLCGLATSLSAGEEASDVRA